MVDQARTNKGVGPDGCAYPKSSGIKVIVLGLGYSGVATAIECYRKGHDVVVYEQFPGVTQLGTLLPEYLLEHLLTLY